MDFLKSNKRFSFKIDNVNSWETEYTVSQTEENNKLMTVYRFQNGLKVTNIAKKHEKYGAYEWVNYFENTAETPTGIISELWDCDAEFSMDFEETPKQTAYLPDPKSVTKIYAPNGSALAAKEFYCDVENEARVTPFTPGVTKSYTSEGGRSSYGTAPFFSVYKNNCGYVFAIGWTGQWNCEITRKNESVIFKSKIEDTRFKMLPGEKFRTSSVVVMPYDTGFTDGQNKWRRLVKEEFSLIGKDSRPQHGPLCAGIWGGMRDASVLDRIEKIKQSNLPFEYIWMDAGWYGADTKPTPNEFEGDWWKKVGDWRVSSEIHAGGLRDISEAVHRAGMKFLLWFEPERSITLAPIAKEHPEYFLRSSICSYIDSPTEDMEHRLLNLGNPDAWNWCFHTLSDMIENLDIDFYRQDFNMDPHSFWRENDADDRMGITEIKHINGLYKLWDSLLEKFPSLCIDNCASGGRRIDIETLRRSMPLWRSDFQCPANFIPEGTQCHTQTFNLWMPYSSTSSGRIAEEYNMRSAYGTAMMTQYSFDESDSFCETQKQTDFLKKYTEEYLKVRPYFSEDFYPLTEVSDALDVWCANQFDRPTEGDGLLQVFRRENSPYETAVLRLSGIDKTATYHFSDLDGGEFEVSGAELSERGLQLTVKQQKKAKIYLYKKCSAAQN